MGGDKNSLFCKGWSCHLHYTKVKEKENLLSGGHGALSHLGSQSTLQPVVNSAQVFEWGRDQSYGVISAPKFWFNPYLLESPSHSTRGSDAKEYLVVISLLCPALALRD